MSSSPTDRTAAGNGRPGATVVAVTLPQMGVSVAEGTVVEWRKQPGERVEADETVCEISSDKIDTDIPAPASGVLARILVDVGKTVPVGTTLAEIELDVPAGAREEAAGANDSQDAPGAPATGPDRSRFYSPVVQRIAAEHGIDLSEVHGTGVGGRVRKKDVLARIEARTADRNGEEAAAMQERTAPVAEPPLHSESPYRPPPQIEQPRVERLAAGPLSPMRRQIAEHMMRSRRTAAHVTTVIEVDMSAVEARRERLRERLAARGVRLTYLAFVAEATVAALQEHPVLNSSLEGEEMVLHDDVNLGIAVALQDGLIVPVARKAQRLSLEGLAAAIGDLSERARSGSLSHDDVGGGTFTITNPGQFGTVLATPIINQPEVAILDLEAVVKRPVVVESPGGDSIAIRPVVNLCLSFDHRALDGAEAARFLGSIKARLERSHDDL